MGLNPLAGLVEGCRAALLGSALNWGQLGLSLLISVALFFAGIAYFRRVERRFADII
jgi:lipopolysaccharide transport system permease protein